MDAIGWAVIENGKIKVRTVSDTRRAAIANFLCTERHLLIEDWMSDGEIERIWCYERLGASVEYVTITLTHPEGA